MLGLIAALPDPGSVAAVSSSTYFNDVFTKGNHSLLVFRHARACAAEVGFADRQPAKPGHRQSRRRSSRSAIKSVA
jgi:hypothetical protein